LFKPRAQLVNPPDLWIHGTAAAAGGVGDKMSDDDRDSCVRPSSRAAPSQRSGSSTSNVRPIYATVEDKTKWFSQNKCSE